MNTRPGSHAIHYHNIFAALSADNGFFGRAYSIFEVLSADKVCKGSFMKAGSVIAFL